MREPVVAGSFYSANAEELKADIHELFIGKFGPGRLADIKKEREEKNLYGVIVPHAGYIYSGQAAAHAYKEIAESKHINTFILLGTDHTGYCSSDFAISLQDFFTPLGSIKNDKMLAKLVIKNSQKAGINAGNLPSDEKAHSMEHSIEVQLPFLQFCISEFMILPVIVSRYDAERCKKFASLLIKSSCMLKRKICVIASSDFTHYGAAYGFLPFTSHVKEHLYALDKKAIDKILNFDTDAFLNETNKTTICGAGAIATCIETCKQLGSKQARLLKYYTSGDIVLHYDSAVGYASIVFR
jgi:hypothetical protein